MKCPVCGKENIESNLYCYSCGARLSGKPPGSDKKKTLQLLLIAVLMGILLVECCLFIINPRPDPGAGPDQEPVAETASTADTEPKPKPKPEPKPVRPDSIPDQYYYHNGHTYGFYNAGSLELDTYDKVAAFCHKQGGHLAVINSQEENEYLFNLVRDNYNKTVFFGYTDKDEEGKWVWDAREIGIYRIMAPDGAAVNRPTEEKTTPSLTMTGKKAMEVLLTIPHGTTPSSWKTQRCLSVSGNLT